MRAGSLKEAGNALRLLDMESKHPAEQTDADPYKPDEGGYEDELVAGSGDHADSGRDPSDSSSYKLANVGNNEIHPGERFHNLFPFIIFLSVYVHQPTQQINGEEADI